MKYTLLIGLLILISLSWGEILNFQDSLLVDVALDKIDLSPQDLMFLKDWSDETYLKNNIIVNSINNPYYFLDYADKINNITNQDDFNKLAYKFLNNNDIELNYPETITNSLDTNLEIADLIDLMETFIQIRKIHYDHIYFQLTDNERGILEDFGKALYNQNIEEDEESISISSPELEKIVKKINWYIFYQPVVIENKEYLTQKLVIKSMSEFINNNIDRILWQEETIIEQTEDGEIIIGSVYDDNHIVNKSIAIIDPAGNDSYTFIENNQDSFFLLDLSGDDIYRSATSLFSANFGFSYAYDMSGNDCYFAKEEAFSAKFGFQEFRDASGDDYYNVEYLGLAAAVFGSSTLIDETGNDVYVTGQYGQGFSSTWGISLLLDEAGVDSYLCGNSEFHAPLAPNDYKSMGQGMGFGMRPDFGGGIGILIDKSGNDRYLGGVYAQGVGYWYGLGFLLDNGGNDFYNAVYYPQGSGIHLAGGFLYDQAGEDSYYSKHGPGQGAGHDFGVGFLIDGAGNDHYSVEGGNGLGLTNSVGIFIDKSGNDRYENGTNSNYGYGKAARGSGSIGLFIDAAGKDFYPHPTMQDSLEWKQGIYGVGIDSDFYSVENNKSSEIKQLPANIDSLATIEEIFKYASEWEVGNVVNRVRRARKILLNRETETVEYIITNKMNTRDTKEYRAIKEFFENSVKSQNRLIDPLATEDSLANKNAIALIGSLELEDLIAPIINFYESDKYTLTCMSAFASFKQDKYIPYITKYSTSSNEKIRFAVASALKTIDSDLAKAELKKMKQDKSFLVRTLVVEYLKKN